MSDQKPACLICRTSSNFLMQKDGFDEYLCPTCQLSFVYPQPAAEWLKEKVYSAESGYQGNKTSQLAVPISSRYSKTMEIILSRKPNGRLLDVGCSTGQFMYWARERGMSCMGVEINKRTAASAAANGFEVHTGFLETAPFQKESFDVMYLGDVIEHVNDPHALVSAATSFLKPDGLLIFSTPNMDCFWSNASLRLYQWFGIPWATVTPPHHLSQFSVGNLNLLLKGHGFGQSAAVFTPPSSLKYELGSLHLYKRFKKERTVGNLIFMGVSFAAYTILYYFNLLLRPFLKKDFQMAVFYERGYTEGHNG